MNALTHQTRIAVQIIVGDDTGTVANFLAALTVLISMLISFGQTVNRYYLELAELTQAVFELVEALGMVVKVYLNWGSIITNSLRYGLGF